jgi:cytochrome c5
MKSWLQGALVLALLSACGGKGDASDQDHDHDSDHDHAGQIVAGSQAEQAAGPTFTLLFDSVFSTCRNPMCHGGGVTGGLDMSSKKAAYDALVDHASSPTSICAMLGKKRVVPNQPEESLLYLKLTLDAPCGQQMPPGGQLRDEQRDQVRAWIEAGAKNN